jgi:hypothetical protein
LHGDLDTSPHQERIKNKTEPVFYELPDSFLLKACAKENARYDEKEWHPETEKENIQELQHRMLICAENICIGQSFMRMPKANQDDADTSGVVYPRVPIPGQNIP